ncbi:MAG: hypothetical protein ACUZ8H_10540 [Candidatus Anammoxibacter sp.]
MIPIQEEKNPFDVEEIPRKRMVFSNGEMIEREFPPRQKNKFDDD